MRILAVVACASLGISVVACGGPQQQKGGLTYHKDVAPLVMQHCAQCHQEGGIAPFPLVTAEQVIGAADVIAQVTAARIMPPSTIDASGACQDFRDARWMTDDEIEVFQQWAKDGAPAGDPSTNTSQLPAIDTLADADVVAAMDTPYTPKGHPEYPNDDYRCFLIEAPTDADRYVQGFEIFPGEPAQVHHMLMFSIADQEGEDDVRARDDADPAPGWECFSTPFDEHTSFLAGWAPGTNVMRYPEETGVWMAGGRPLVMQIHYNLLGGARPDTTTVTLKTVAEVTKEAALVPIPFTDVIYDLRLPPHQANAKQEFSQALFGLADDIELHGVFPHMHTLGTKMHFSVRESGQAREDAMCLSDVWRWDFHWQQLFLYDDPLVIRPSDYLDLSCEYDTRGRETDTTWGEGTQDEMCLMFVYITRLGGGPLSELLQ